MTVLSICYFNRPGCALKRCAGLRLTNVLKKIRVNSNRYDTILYKSENDRNTNRHKCKSVSWLNSKTIERESEHKKHRNATN